MTMLIAPVALHDVLDTESFVHATINKARLVLSHEERDELVSEGMAIMCRLARDYRPHIAGHAQEGRFSGYAAQFLPRKLGDAWHRMHPEHQLRTHADGKRRWTYGEKAVSLEALTADDPDRHDLLAAPAQESDMRANVRRALEERWARRREVILNVADILGSGGTEQDAMHMLGLTRPQVQEAVTEIMLVADRLQSEA